MARVRAKPLVFRGERRTLSVALPERWAVPAAAPRLKLDAPDGEQARVRFVRLRAGQGRGLRIVVAPTTPPGSYKGEIAVGGERQRIVVDVPADSRLRITPVEPEVTVQPGGEAQLALLALNVGNVPQDLPEHPALRFYGPSEPPSAYDVKIPGLDRFVAVTARLAPAEGPVADVDVVEGAGTLAAGESSALSVAIRADAALAPRDRYVGEWLVPGDNVVIGLTVGGGSNDGETT